jgi:protein-L-isoaspartate(D-aspartate) O-methyltransferase
MTSNSARLVSELNEQGIPRGPILDAIRYVPRNAFVPRDKKQHAWENRALSIGADQTISQPYTVARMLQLCGVGSGDRVLEVGGGSGYAAALLAYVVGDMGSVTTIEVIPSLAAQAAATLRAIGLTKVLVIQGDGRGGYPPRAPFDRILVSAQAAEIPPDLLEQLREGGTLVMPVEEGADAYMTRVVREQGEYTRTRHGLFAFVPLR